MYKADIGIGRKQTSTTKNQAAKAVTKSASRDINTTGKDGRIWKMSEIQKLKPWEFEKYEAEIDQASRSGRIENDS